MRGMRGVDRASGEAAWALLGVVATTAVVAAGGTSDTTAAPTLSVPCVRGVEDNWGDCGVVGASTGTAALCVDAGALADTGDAVAAKLGAEAEPSLGNGATDTPFQSLTRGETLAAACALDRV